MFSCVNNFFSSAELIKADNVCDKIPILSTLSNLIDLFQNCVVIPCMKDTYIYDHDYLIHIKNKSVIRCIVLLVPVIGNIMIDVYDSVSRPQRRADCFRAVTRLGGAGLMNAGEFRDDEDIVRAAVRRDGQELRYASERWRNNKEMALAALRRTSLAWPYVSEDLRNDLDIQAQYVEIRQWESATKRGHAGLWRQGDAFQDNEQAVLTAVRWDGCELFCASPRLRDNEQIVLAAVTQNGEALRYASERLRNIQDIALAALRQTSRPWPYVGESFKRPRQPGDHNPVRDQYEGLIKWETEYE